MAVWRVKLRERWEVAAGTMAFRFERPEGLEFKAGQFGSFTLVDPPETDAQGNTRAFTFANAPCEDGLVVATRMRNTAFKRVLGAMEPGTEVQLRAPNGSFTLHEDAGVPAVFLAGGIGITPARSIVRQAAHERLPHEITLFYSNRTPEDAAFLDEFTRLPADHPRFTLVATMTEAEKSRRPWSGETGFITQAMLAKRIPDFRQPIFYVAGPREMVAAISALLAQAGAESSQVRVEKFSGY